MAKREPEACFLPSSKLLEWHAFRDFSKKKLNQTWPPIGDLVASANGYVLKGAYSAHYGRGSGRKGA